jgi:hypothetical protein
MPKYGKIIKVFFLLLIMAFFALTGCVAAKQNPYVRKKSKASHVSTSQLGRNRYYFSVGYQKKLTKSYKK